MATVEGILGLTEPKHFVEQRHRSIVIDYLIATSTHGLRSVGRAYSTRNRIFWSVIFMAATGLMLYFVISAVLQYYAYPTQTKVEINLDLSMAFPAVTVCSENPYRYDKTNVSLVNYFYRQYSANATFNQTFINSLYLELFVDLFNGNKIPEWQSIGFQLSDILLACTYNGIDCSNAFTPSISSILGNCYTFNWKTSTNFVTLANFSNVLVIREGLSMTFYIPREIFFPVTLFDIGLAVLLHDNDELPLPDENGFDLQPGLSHTISYRKSETTFLPPPYTQCTSEVGTDLRALYQMTFLNQTASLAVAYSESVCRELCEQAYIFSQCSCILPIPFLTRRVRMLDGNLISSNFCDPIKGQLLCALNSRQKFSASGQLQSLWCTQCAPQCKHIYFNSDLSAQSAPSETEKEYWAATLLSGNNTTSILVPNDFAQRFDYYFERNYLKVLVSCGSKYVTEYIQEPKLTLIDTFSAVGGQTGLWIGLSVLSVIELGELLYRLVYKRIALWRSQRIVPPAPRVAQCW